VRERDVDAIKEKERLLASLERSRQSSIAALSDVDDYRVIYPESGWRVKDVLGHLAAWEREVLASIQAFNEGDVYTLGTDHVLDIYNEESYEKRKGLHPAQCRMDWGMVRRDLQFAILELDAARLHEEMQFPWGAHGSVIQLIEEIVQHEEEHIREILALHASAEESER
jgi:hypothetical protein